jgi:hypothetical protein
MGNMSSIDDSHAHLVQSQANEDYSLRTVSRQLENFASSAVPRIRTVAQTTQCRAALSSSRFFRIVEAEETQLVDTSFCDSQPTSATQVHFGDGFASEPVECVVFPNES